MPKLFLLILSLFLGLELQAQVQTVSQQPSTQDQKSVEIDQHPIYPGGIPAFRSAVLKAFNTKSIRTPGFYSTDLLFIIDVDGSITNIDAKGDSPLMNKEAIKALKLIKKKWSPAIINGKPARYSFKLPLKLVI